MPGQRLSGRQAEAGLFVGHALGTRVKYLCLLNSSNGNDLASRNSCV